MDDFFIFGNFDSRDYGLLVFPQNPYDANNAEVKVTSRFGRNGVIFSKRKYLGANEKRYTCILMNCNNPTLSLSEIKASLFSIYSGAQKLEDSLDKEVFYIGEVSSDFAIKKNYRDTDFLFDVSFTVQPQRFLKDGQHEIFNPTEINNPTHNNAHPVVTFTTSETAGSISFGIDSALSFSRLETGTTVIFDADTLDARAEDGSSLNGYIYIGNDVFLRSGLNTVMTYGVSDLKIVPRWWIL